MGRGMDGGGWGEWVSFGGKWCEGLVFLHLKVSAVAPSALCRLDAAARAFGVLLLGGESPGSRSTGGAA